LLTVPTLTLAASRRRVVPGAVAVFGLAASVTALSTSLRVRQVERDWENLREELINSASETLGGVLFDAAELASGLADSALAVASSETQVEAFRRLRLAVDAGGPEHGAVLLDSAWRAVAWAGSHRLAPIQSEAELSARITPFYVLLEAQRQRGAYVGVGQVVLAADSAVPDRDRTLAVRFNRETDATLRFYPPDEAPVAEDVFDYYLEGQTPPDTLFTVRTIPPAQGTLKLDVLGRGTQRATLLLIVTLALLAACAGAQARWLGVIGLTAALVLTPAGAGLGLGNLFSGATYYLGALGPVAESAGSLLITSALAIAVLVPLARMGARVWRPGVVVACVLIVAAPYTVTFLATGITPPTTGVGVDLWLSWQAALSAATAVLLLASAVLLRRIWRWVAPIWVHWTAAVWGGAVAVVGLFVWTPANGCPAWYPLVWIPPMILAALPAQRVARIISVSVVVGASAALLTWCGVVEGRLVLAERDVTRASGGDPFARGLLDEFGSQLLEGNVPRTSADLYAAWRRSALSLDDFPAVLSTWDPNGYLVARLDLARLDVRPALLQELARTARDSATSLETRVVVPPTLFVRNVPFPDGSVVSVAVGPVSRLIEPVRLGRFLRGERELYVPYEMSLGGDATGSAEFMAMEWVREGWNIRGVGTLGPRDDQNPIDERRHQVHVLVPLGSLGGTVLRGVLVVFWTLSLVALFWTVGELLSGGIRIGPAFWESMRLRSYRVRLTIALAGFFILPTIGFATWSIMRLRVSAAHSGDLIIQETLSDAVGAARQFSSLAGADQQERLTGLAEGLNADLLWYENGSLRHSSPSTLAELGLVGAFLPPQVYEELLIRAEPNVTVDEFVGGQPTRVGYRGLDGGNAVLAAPRLVDIRDIQSGREDLLFGLLLATVLGLAAASRLAALAAQSLAKPVRSLRRAAIALGKGEPLPGFEPGAPIEFVPVFEAFERMASDIEASQSALEDARRRTAAVLRNVATGVVALDPGLRVTIANPRAGQLLRAALPAGARVDVVSGQEWGPVWDWARRFLRSGHESDSREFTVVTSQIRAQATAIHGDPGGCVLALDDTTELTHAVRILAWGELARQVAHEIKNPLTPIRLGIQHLSRAHRDGRDDFAATLDRTAKQILAEIERLDAIARAFSRFGAPPAEAEPLSSADLSAIAGDAAELYALAEGTGVVVEAEGPTLAWVRKDEVKEVLVNLIENARDAGATEIRVAVGQESDETAAIRVHDDGKGIPADDLPLIFEPQFSTTTSGAGLGLAISKRLVESWGGTISVESRAGEGTVVTILIKPAGRAN